MTIASLLSTFSDIRSILGKTPSIGYGANIAFEIWRIDNSNKMKVRLIRFEGRKYKFCYLNTENLIPNSELLQGIVCKSVG